MSTNSNVSVKKYRNKCKETHTTIKKSKTMFKKRHKTQIQTKISRNIKKNIRDTYPQLGGDLGRSNFTAAKDHRIRLSLSTRPTNTFVFCQQIQTRVSTNTDIKYNHTTRLSTRPTTVFGHSKNIVLEAPLKY